MEKCKVSKAADIANLGDHASRVDLADSWNRGQGIGNDLELLLNGFVKRLDLVFQCPHSCDGGRHDLVYRIIHGFGQAVRALGGSLNGFGSGFWVRKSAMPGLIYKGRQFIQACVGQIVYCFKVFHEREGGSAGVGDVLALRNTRAFQKQIICKPFLFPA